MKSRAFAGIATLTLALFVAPGCSKKSSPAQPTSGGGTPTVSFNSGTFSSGSSPNVFVHTFASEGTFGYFCSIHGSPTSGMRGTIHCAIGMPESTTVNVADNSFIPSAAHVRPGGYVKWVATGGNHTVTR